ncbi:MAG: peptidoglycan-binding protein [Chromatiaceae bacterium]
MTSRIFVTTMGFTCASQLSSMGGPAPGGQAAVVIQAPVGGRPPPRCRNFSGDVRTIQQALNRFSPLDGGPAVKLAVDGICGPKTNSAIHHFQKKWALVPKGWKVPDGIVDVDGPTIVRLRKGPGFIPNLPVEFMARIPRVMQAVTAARAALEVAKTHLQLEEPTAVSGPFPSIASFGEAAFKRADRHFHIAKLANPLARLNQLESVFLSMQTAIGYIPQGVVLATDEPSTVAEGAYMFTFEGGYHQRGKADTWNGIPVASIYLCPKSRTLNQDAFAYAMIHELAHYTGPANNGIIDQAYFHKDQNKYRSLSPDRALHNADCYSQFAFDAIGKSDFMIDRNAY